MPRKKRILSISYDESLLTTRKLLLEQEGFDVVSAFGSAEARIICRVDHNFDLIVMGHSIPQADKSALVEILRPNCKTPLLVMHKPLEMPIPEADFSVNSADGPEALIAAVKAALETPKPVSSTSGVSSSARAESSRRRQSPQA